MEPDHFLLDSLTNTSGMTPISLVFPNFKLAEIRRLDNFRKFEGSHCDVLLETHKMPTHLKSRFNGIAVVE